MAGYAMLAAAGVALIAPNLSAVSPEASELVFNERELREISAKHYSEILRLSCRQGHSYRADLVARGFDRHFKELRLTVVDQGYAVTSASHGSHIVLTDIRLAARRSVSTNAWEFGCFAGHWIED